MSMAARLAAFAVAVAAAVAGGAAVGATIGPDPDDRPAVVEGDDHGGHG